ncbi:MAG TPA: hypothetical protein VFX19_14420, partial [Dehalococcoidia bacterium]|nr:hypothetical protein [Dehalococcoidia bacterium]
MLRAVFRKAWSDSRGRPLQAVLLFIVIAAAATTLSVALNVRASSARPYDRLREEANGAGAWIGAVSLSTDLSRLNGLGGVEEVGEPYPVSWENYGLRNGEKKQQIALVGLPAALPEFDHPVITDGRWLGAGATNELVLDSGAASVLKLHIGQSVKLLTPTGPEPFTLVGFAVT